MRKQGMFVNGGSRFPDHESIWLYQTKWGKRRRYRCQTCGKTFYRNSGTLYHRLQHRRATFDEVAALSVEGLNKSAIARVRQIVWNTVDHWLERAAGSCRRFNDRRITGLNVTELQADEMRTMVGGKEQPIWIFVSIDVWSRLWPSTIVGRRSYQNTLGLFRDISSRMNHKGFPLIATDGFEYYKRVVRRVFGAACLYGQVTRFILWCQGSMPLCGSILPQHSTRPPLRHSQGLADTLHCLPPSARAQKFPADASFRIARSNA